MKKLIGGLAIASLLAMGVGVGVAMNVNNPVETKADESNPITTVYLDLSVFGGADYDYYAYMWTEANTSVNVSVKASLVAGMDSLYQVANGINADSIVVAAVTKDAAFSGENWSNVVSQTWDRKPSWSNGIPLQNDGDGKNTLVVQAVSDGKRNAYWDTRNPAIADGAYLRGKYHGVTNWGSNIVLSNDKVTESIIFDSAANEAYATLELYAGDIFKFNRFFNGKDLGMPTTYSIRTSDETYYNAGWSDNNVTVEHNGIYYVSMGYGTGDDASNVWYYVDNSATAWSKAFLESMTCNSGGNDPLTWNNRVGETKWEWNDFATAGGAYPYSTLDEYAKNTLYNAVASDDGTLIQQAAKRHDVCVKHYKWDAFMTNSSGSATRSAAKFASESALVTAPGLSPVVVITAAAIATVAIGGFFVIRKRRAE